MTDDLAHRCRLLVRDLGLADPDAIRDVRPLTGGVASDIAVVDLGDRRICIKFALPKLKVAADWQAPVERNAAEYAWLKAASAIAPESALALLGHSEALHGFAMEYLDGPDVYLWKANLLAGAEGRGEAARVGDLLGRIHAASAKPGFDRAPFHNNADFRALRIEPYLLHTADAHPALSASLRSLATMLDTGQQVLVHGDASPKNILFRKGAPILLDAECATMGDASFDPAFCLNHLVLKAIHLPASRDGLLRDIGAFWRAYARHVDWETADDLESRVAGLIPALMLARVDGKSPVEYLTAAEQACVRAIAAPLVRVAPTRIEDFTAHVSNALKESSEWV